MTNRKVSNQKNQSPRSKWVIGLIGVAVAGFAACAMMKPLVCGKTSEGCPCNNQPEEDSCQEQGETPPAA